MRIVLATLWLVLSLVVYAEAQFISGGGGGGGGGGSSAPQQFYVSSSGSDSNSGLSPTSPWQTIAKVNSSSFSAGSVVNLMTNLTGCFNLSSTSNGTGPLTIQSYPPNLASQVVVTCGAASQNFGNNLIGHMLDGINGMTVNNIKFTNPNADAGTFTWASTSNPNYQFGILFQNSANANPISITFTNNTVTGYSNEVGFMYPSAQSNWATCGAGFNGVTITGNTIGGTSTSSHDVAGVGFYGSQSEAGGGFCNSTVTNFATNIMISNNTFQFLEGSSTGNNNWPYASTGVMIGNAQNVTVSNNYIHDIGLNMTACPGPQGSWSGYTNNVTWKNNEIATVGGLGSSSSSCDQHGINPGGQTLANTLVNNYIHDVNGAGIFLQALSFGTAGPGFSATVANNIIQNARWAAILTQNNNDAGVQGPVLIYNNTLILTGGELGFAGVGTLSNASGSKFENNIIYAPYLATLNTTVGFLVQTPDVTNTTFDYNDYFVNISPASPAPWKLGASTFTTFSAWKTGCSTCDTHSVFADPGLTTEPVIYDGFNLHDPAGSSCSPGLAGPGQCPAMSIYSNSPANRSGLGGLSGNPSLDYYGNHLPVTPSMGASQVPVSKTNISFDTSVTGTTTTVSLTTAGTNEMIFAGVVSNGASSCTIADGSSLTWTLLGQGGSGTNIVTAWEAFSAAKQTSDTITFTCTSETFLQTGVMAFRGALGVHDTGTGLPATSATGPVVSGAGADGVLVAFGRSSTATPSQDTGFTTIQDGNSTLMEYHLFNIPQVGVNINLASGTNGTVADVWH